MAITISGNGISSDAIASLAATKLTGQVPDANAPSGSVIQVLQATKTDTQTLSGLNTTFSDITGLSITITPTSASSRILILSSIVIGMGGNPSQYRVLRNSTSVLQGDAAGSRKLGLTQFHDYNGVGIHNGGFFNTIVDSPNTTSAITYKPQVSIGGGSTHYVNRTIRDNNDSSEDLRGASSFIVMEIAG